MKMKLGIHGSRPWELAVLNQDSLRDFGYLRECFDTFQSLVDIIVLLRNVALDPTMARGWTYMLPYPIGPASFYDEGSLKREKEGFEKTRILFTRTGELAYLMMSRASKELRTHIAERLQKVFQSDTTPRVSFEKADRTAAMA